MIEQKFVDRIAEETGARPEQVAAAIQLFDADATIPFVARYRKDLTDNLPEHVLEKVQERNKYFKELSSSRTDILNNIERQGLLTEALRANIEGVFDKTTLQDLYLSFKKQKRTKANTAREHGLEPLAHFLWQQAPEEREVNEFASTFINSGRGLLSPEEALEGALHIIAEWVAFDAATRAGIRRHILDDGRIKTTLTRNAADDRRFQQFADFQAPLTDIAPGKLLLLLRGERQRMVHRDLLIDDARMLEEMSARFIKNADSQYATHLRQALEDAYRNHLRPTIEREVMDGIREKADDHVLHGLRQSLENLLLAPAAGAIAVAGIDIQRTGSRLAVIDARGAYLTSASILFGDDGELDDVSKQTLIAILEEHAVSAVAIAKSGKYRELERSVSALLRDSGKSNAFTYFVSDAGAAAYGASKAGRDEYPDLDFATRSAISIARRLQNPLAELVKIEPKQLGLGQHQHDITPRLLREGLYRTVESCVNRVGVNINDAPLDLLRYVAGLTMGHAQNIVKFREENGGFKSRQQLIEVPGIGASKYEQCAGFLRIFGGENPLDATAIHPEAYPLVDKIAESAGMPLPELLGNRNKLRDFDFAPFADGVFGAHTLRDIRGEMMRPGRDPRSPFKVPRLLQGVTDVTQIEEGTVCDGVVTNITEFGAFVDIGVGQDGLVHLSELANHFVRDPHQVVKIGEVVPVKVIKVDKDTKRVSLSMKALMAERRPPRRPAPRRRDGAAEGVPAAVGTDAVPAGEARTDGRADRPQREGAPRVERGAREGAPRGDRNQDRGRSRDDRRRDPQDRPRPPRRNEPPRRAQASRLGTPSAVKHSDSTSSLNTLLADQLASLREKIGE